MKTSKLFSIQALRAYAALSVLCGHACEEWAAAFDQSLGFHTRALTFGVDVFFVISGFIMYNTAAETFGKPGASLEFLRRRVIRIVPLYWIFTTLMALSTIFLAAHVHSTTLTPWTTFSSYIFWPAERESGRIAPILSLGWTLNYEMFFYALFAVALLFPLKRGLACLAVSIFGIAAFGWLAAPTEPALRFWSDPIILEFAAGVALAIGYRRVRIASIPGAALCFALGFGALFAQCIIGGEAHRVLLGGGPALLLVAGAALLPPSLDARIPGFVVLLGDSSYALYLCHRFVMRIYTIGLDVVSPAQTIDLGLYLAGLITLTIIASIIVYKFVEIPTLSWLRTVSTAPAHPALTDIALRRKT